MRKTEPFGERAIHMGFASEEEVKKALETQQMLNMKQQTLADILLELGKITSEDCYRLITRLHEGSPGSTDGKDPFCEAAKKLNMITQEDENIARLIKDKWQKRNKLIGEIMVELGDLSEQQLQQILDTYKSQENS